MTARTEPVERTLEPQSALSLYTVLPFAFMLLSIAILPLWIPHWWERNRNKLLVASLLGLPVLTIYLMREPSALVRMGEEYVSSSFSSLPCTSFRAACSSGATWSLRP